MQHTQGYCQGKHTSKHFLLLDNGNYYKNPKATGGTNESEILGQRLTKFSTAYCPDSFKSFQESSED